MIPSLVGLLLAERRKTRLTSDEDPSFPLYRLCHPVVRSADVQPPARPETRHGCLQSSPWNIGTWLYILTFLGGRGVFCFFAGIPDIIRVDLKGILGETFALHFLFVAPPGLNMDLGR